MSHITWKESRYSSQYGFAGKTELVSVHWSSMRTGPRWIVKSRICDIPESLHGSDDLVEAKSMAEEAVTRWLTAIGAQWIPEE